MVTYVQGRRTLVLKLLIYFVLIIYEMGAVVIYYNENVPAIKKNPNDFVDEKKRGA
jgi:hypothetical protein